MAAGSNDNGSGIARSCLRRRLLARSCYRIARWLLVTCCAQVHLSLTSVFCDLRLSWFLFLYLDTTCWLRHFAVIVKDCNRFGASGTIAIGCSCVTICRINRQIDRMSCFGRILLESILSNASKTMDDDIDDNINDENNNSGDSNQSSKNKTIQLR